MDSVEWWDLYDEEDRLTGLTMRRGDPVPDGLYHLAVHVWIKNSEGKYLISQRAATRMSDPLLFECVGGSVVKGEESLPAAIREAEEEVGAHLNPDLGKVLCRIKRRRVNGDRYNDILDVWIFPCDHVDFSDATTDEVNGIRWLTREEIIRLKDEGKTVPGIWYFFDEKYADLF